MIAGDDKTLELSHKLGKALHGYSFDQGEKALTNMLVDLIVQGTDNKAQAMMSAHHVGCALIHAVYEVFDSLKSIKDEPDTIGKTMGKA